MQRSRSRYQNTLADGLEYPYTVFPLVVAGRLALGLAIAVFVPGLARRVGVGLAREEGLAVPGAEEQRDERQTADGALDPYPPRPTL